ncbi:C-type lectin domain family 10 member A-like isoform X2 [Polyodon spathula]|uniref:C-type lectin domain family 10 member A-like isoform X2 n=1 Tax=Polyodon spathula TaxID=7913 RepID=UPI001B7E8980|nr:C-type lectin domain family 10 member A-like isoform X2 [Polyodon spathula]
MASDVLYSTVDFSQKNQGKRAANKTNAGKEDDVTYATVKFGEAPSRQKQQAASSSTAGKEDDVTYATVKFGDAASRQQQQAASSNTADPIAGKTSPYRWSALVLAGLCTLSVAAIIFLSVYISNFQTKNLKLQSQYSELERNYTDTVTNFQTKNLELQSQYSELERNYTNISATVSKLTVERNQIQSWYSELEKNYSNISKKYSALDQYCPIVDTSSKERVCKSCPQNWELFNGKCYYFSTDKMNWNSSRDNCTSLGGHLVIIESDGEQKFLSDKAWNITQANIIKEEEKAHWIGLTDAVTEGTWLWVDGTPLIGNVQAKFWGSRIYNGVDYGKEPDNYTGVDPSGEDCAQLQPKRNSNETWFDALCTKQYKRICETKTVIA